MAQQAVLEICTRTCETGICHQGELLAGFRGLDGLTEGQMKEICATDRNKLAEALPDSDKREGLCPFVVMYAVRLAREKKDA